MRKLMAEQLHGNALIDASRRLQGRQANNSDSTQAYDGILHIRNSPIVGSKIDVH